MSTNDKTEMDGANFDDFIRNPSTFVKKNNDKIVFPDDNLNAAETGAVNIGERLGPELVPQGEKSDENVEGKEKGEKEEK